MNVARSVGQFARPLAAVLASLLVVACAKSPETLIGSAREYLEKGDSNAAVIQLKNALQVVPDSGEARMLLGRALIGQRDFPSAEKELRRALELGQPPDAVLPQLARALLEAERHETLIRDFGNRSLADTDAQAVFQTRLGDGYLKSGNAEAAERAYAAALKARPGYPLAELGRARLLAMNLRIDEALKAVGQITAAAPDVPEALTFRGELLRFKGEREEALKAFDAAIAADSAYLPARTARVQLLIGDKAFDKALEELNAARKAARGNLLLTYLEGTLHFERGEIDKARDSAAQVLKYAPDYVPALELAGKVELRAKQFASAETHLQKAISLYSGAVAARRALVGVYLVTGQPQKAVAVLRPLLETSAMKDPRMMMLAGEAFRASGDLKQASTYFSMARGSDQTAAEAQVRLGQVALARGDTDSGLKQLEEASEKDAGNFQADLELILGHIRRNELDKALAAARNLQKKQPANPISHQMLGVVNVARKDPAAARKNFEKALDLQPNFLPAVTGLVHLDMAEKKFEAARKRLDDIIAKDPNNERVYLALAEYQARTGATAGEMAATLQRAIRANALAAEPRLALINLYLREGNAKLALQAGQEAAAALPAEPRVLSGLAMAQERAGDVNQAIETLNKLITLQPQSGQGLRQLAGLQIRQKNPSAAIDALKRAQRVAPNDKGVQRDLIVAYGAAGRYDDALKEAKAIQSREPKFAGAYEIEGDIHSTLKKWPEAEGAYREALKRDSRNGAFAVKLHAVMVTAGKTADADSYARKWLSDHPKDTSMRMHLAGRALGAGNGKEAFGLYQQVIAIEPNNVVALNNLGSIGGELGDSRAQEYAERAVALAPNSANVLDTLGMLLVNKGDIKKGFEHLDRARALAPDVPVLRLNYSKALIKAGRKEEARKELEALKQVTASFPGKDTIDALLKSI
jgi:putative PEP-CTERM system TPR-repeat lipoprotein